MTLPITLVVSIDTEEDNWQPTRQGITVENIRELPRLQRVFERLGVRPTYFVTYQVAVRAWAAEIVRGITAGGSGEIGAHLHPWNTPPVEEELTPRNTMLVNLPQALQEAKIARLTDTLHETLGQRPRSFRAGRWGFGQSTAAALLACGYGVDSSVTPFESWRLYGDGPTHVGAPLDVYRLDGRSDTRVARCDGALVEVPLSAGYSRGAIRNWARWHGLFERPLVRRLRLAAVASRLRLLRHVGLDLEIESVDNMLVLSQHLIAQGVRLLHVSWHSPSLRPGLTPFRATHADVERLYGALDTYVERLAAVAPLRFATVSEAAEMLAEPRASIARASGVGSVPRPERRLVVLSYHHPPDGAIGGMRWAALTKYLQPLGWKSWIVTAATPTPASNGSGTVVVSCPRRVTLNDRYARFRHLLAGVVRTPEVAPVAEASESNGGGGLRARIRLEASLLLSLPDQGRGWILRATARARKLIRQMKPDVVVSTGPPHSAHLVAWLATRGLPVRRLVDLRDPWAGPITAAWRSSPMFRSYASRWLHTWLEHLVLSQASGVLCNSREFAEAMRSRYPEVAAHWIPNGVDPELLPPAAEPFPGPGLVYIGTMYGGRDLRPVLRALRMFLDRHPEQLVDGPALRVAGALDDSATRDAFRRDIAALGLQDQVVELGMLNRTEALQLAARARLALVLAQGQELQVPAKLYELIGIGIPTLVIASPEDAASSEARRVGAAAADPADSVGILQVLENACLGRVTRSAGPHVSVDYRALALLLDPVLTPVESDVADPAGIRQ